MSLFYINVETIGKCNNVKINKLKKIYTSPANEFLLHTVEAIGKLKVKKIDFEKNVPVQMPYF